MGIYYILKRRICTVFVEKNSRWKEKLEKIQIVREKEKEEP